MKLGFFIVFIFLAQILSSQVHYEGIVIDADTKERMLHVPIISLGESKVWRTDLDGKYSFEGDTGILVYIQYGGGAYSRVSKRLKKNDTIFLKSNISDGFHIVTLNEKGVRDFVGNLEESRKDSLIDEKVIHYKIKRLLSSDSTLHLMPVDYLVSFSVQKEFNFDDQNDVISYAGDALDRRFYLYDLLRDRLIEFKAKEKNLKLAKGIYEIYFADSLESYLAGVNHYVNPCGILFND